jgi:F-type H+-transporting ATPase subunit epsilon
MSRGNTFPLHIFSIDREVFVGQANSLTVPAATGQMQILAQHTPLVSLLKEGEVIIESNSGVEQKLPITGGVVQVTPSEVTALVNF